MVGYNHNEHYLPIVIRNAPKPCGTALDVGCGDGRLLRPLARVSGVVTGIDPDPPSAARSATVDPDRIEVIQDDFLVHDFGGRRFDYITAVASIHHMPFRDALQKMRSLLNPGGQICVIGLYRTTTPTDYLTALGAAPVNLLLGTFRNSPPMDAPAMNPTMTLAAIRSESKAALPGARVRRLLLWRYLLTWAQE